MYRVSDIWIGTETTVMIVLRQKEKTNHNHYKIWVEELIKPDKLKSLQSDIFEIMKIGLYPIKSRLLLFLKRNIVLKNEFET